MREELVNCPPPPPLEFHLRIREWCNDECRLCEKSLKPPTGWEEEAEVEGRIWLDIVLFSTTSNRDLKIVNLTYFNSYRF